MATLAALKAEIADDLDRTDLTTQIADAISSAIRYYQNEHFYFNETRDKTFATVADQTWYSSSDDADIGQFIDIDTIHVTVSNNRYILTHYPIETFELLTDANASTGQPYAYTQYNRQIGVYPQPDGVYTIRFVGAYMLAEPATDSEADNSWMVEAYDLIRARALRQIYAFKLYDADLATGMQALATDELNRLRRETSKRHSTNTITPTQF